MMKSKKEQISRRLQIVELIKRQPGITSAELARKLNLENSTKVSTAIWPSVKAGKVLVERIVRDGTTMNAHYLSDDVPPDAVERIQQKIVDAKNVIPIAKSDDARSSVFDTKRLKTKRKPRVAKRAPAAPHAAPHATTPIPKVGPAGFACAVTNDGSLVLMREGAIQFALSSLEATTLQSYLVKRAAASLFASMT
ncbi:hypothetical protein [Burkholderia cenocepacia]|uniref:hypothetical protein n=1 Tax=Burkholderia cenocepacia TaxID=95486 RepID=UPI001B8EA77F|nr:hypothetical protein [Burkholderia cenocepacia]MBR7969071.1 hypothetical protein [Burkholderia cenocepacia]MCW5137582.1 hypothetical protein [Burkholderia cenocepacia]